MFMASFSFRVSGCSTNKLTVSHCSLVIPTHWFEYTKLAKSSLHKCKKTGTLFYTFGQFKYSMYWTTLISKLTFFTPNTQQANLVLLGDFPSVVVRTLQVELRSNPKIWLPSKRNLADVILLFCCTIY